MKRTKEKGITLVALIVTIILLLILAGITIAQLTGSGLFEKAKEAKLKHENAQIQENGILSEYENAIVASRDGLSEEKIRQIVKDEISKNVNSLSRKEVIWNTTQVGTREVDFNLLEKRISDYDLLIVYYHTANTSGEVTFETSQTSGYSTNYTYINSYVVGAITTNLENNKITMSVSGNESNWTVSSQTYLTKVVGIKL